MNKKKHKITPIKIRLDLASICQLKCPLCLTGRRELKSKSAVKPGFLKLYDFKNLIVKNPWIQKVETSSRGEVFLNPNFKEIIKFGSENNVEMSIGTGVNLNDCKIKDLECLVKYQVNNITCSIDGATQKTYAIYRKGGNLEKVIKNIQIINEFKKKYDSNKPYLTWQFVVFGHNEHEIKKAKETAQSLGMNFFPKLSWDSKYSPIKNTAAVKRDIGMKMITRENILKKTNKSYYRSICTQLWLRPQINFNGDILGCCENIWGIFGNGFKNGLLEEINNEKMNYARQMLMGEQPVREDIVCSKCERYFELKSKNAWISENEIEAPFL
ncbi:MAG: radical SAM protein [Pseudomonadota bacterium]